MPTTTTAHFTPSEQLLYALCVQDRTPGTALAQRCRIANSIEAMIEADDTLAAVWLDIDEAARLHLYPEA